MRFAFLLAACLTVFWHDGARAQDTQTLADIRQELNVLFVEIQRLRRELSTTGGPTVNIGGDSVLERVGAMEAELQRLTSKTEELEFRVNRIVEDGTRRIGDLEFRLVELEGGDVSQLGETTTLGGDTATPSPGTSAAPAPSQPSGGDGAAGAIAGGAELAVGEEADFRAAQAALAEGRYREAADRFEVFQSAYPGSPLSPGADLGRGRALEELGETQAAARAYLNSFSTAPTGPVAAQSLFRLGRSLGALNQTGEACLTLGEVEIRFPSDPAVQSAREEMQRLGCA